MGYVPEIQAFGVVSIVVWGIVMYLFESDKSVL